MDPQRRKVDTHVEMDAWNRYAFVLISILHSSVISRISSALPAMTQAQLDIICNCLSDDLSKCVLHKQHCFFYSDPRPLLPLNFCCYKPSFPPTHCFPGAALLVLSCLGPSAFSRCPTSSLLCLKRMQNSLPKWTAQLLPASVTTPTLCRCIGLSTVCFPSRSLSARISLRRLDSCLTSFFR